MRREDFLPSTHRINSGMLIIMLILTCFGLIMLFSASMSGSYIGLGDAMAVVYKQAGITAIGLILGLFLAIVLPLKIFDRFWISLVLFGITTVLLILVKFPAFSILMNGARRWLEVPIIGSFQPSELAKIAMVFCFAGYISMIRRRRAKGGLRFKTPLRQFIADGWLDILLPTFTFFVWIGLVVSQPHLSGGLIMGFVLLVILLAAGIRSRSWVSAITQFTAIILVLGMLFVAVLPILKANGLEEKINEEFDHVGDRITTFLYPDQASADQSYQVEQSLIAIGSGGIDGVGLGAGRQKYNYLPEPYNDFIFAVIGEELGFVGTVMVLLLFMLFMLVGMSITLKAANPFATILAGGFTLLITMQALLNIGVATRSIPATGISLPLFSYGGTSNLLFLVAIGFILAVSKSGQRISRDRLPEAPASNRTEVSR